MKRRMAAALAAVMVAGILFPATVFAAERSAKSVGADGRVPAKWNLAKPEKKSHADVAPPSASGSGDGYNSMSFSYFDSGDMVVVLGTSTGHAGVFDRARYVSLNSYAVLSANTTPKNGVQYETCVKYRRYDEAYGLWVPARDSYGSAVRYYCRSKLNKPYDIMGAKTDETSFYCSKLAWLGWYRCSGLDLDGDGGYWVWPIDLVNASATYAFGHWL
ncbi:MAG: hypothetical protein Q7W16_00875 [Coriobacteriia bacterium]|nr:hypothetical protein [Coriobacteriia bacterium]